jgi:hypothetical protein
MATIPPDCTAIAQQNLQALPVVHSFGRGQLNARYVYIVDADLNISTQSRRTAYRPKSA